MTNDQKLELIQSYIDDIKAYADNEDMPYNEKQHIRRALTAYEDLFEDTKRGKIDPDVLHENITSFLYMLQ